MKNWIIKIKNFGRSIIPASVFKAAQPLYHGTVARYATFHFKNPSDELIVIGVTGTAGKSTTINALAHILNTNGQKTGFITTTNYNDGKTESLNKHGLSMPGGWMIQQQLREISDNGCLYAIVECTSEGLAQNRHRGVNFDVAIITNLSPAHIDAHGSFENYKAAKGKLFEALTSGAKKKIFPRKISGVNLDDENASYYSEFPADQKFGITTRNASGANTESFRAHIGTTEPAITFTLSDTAFTVAMVGQFNAYNLIMAAACANVLGISFADCAAALRTFKGVPGRMETIENNRGFKIIVDYACEPQPLQSSIQAVTKLPHRNLIHVFGATGGHRDVAKRFAFGEISARTADEIIITNDDVYESDPQSIADNIREGINNVPEAERKAKNISIILDRREAIKHALSIAQPEDIVLLTGKGSEQFLVVPGNKRIAWDDRATVTEELNNTPV